MRVQSEPGRGSTFTVTIPLGAAPLPPDRTVEGTLLAAMATGRSVAFLSEAAQWLGDDVDGGEDATLAGDRPRVLLADDDADMRAYVRRILWARSDSTCSGWT